ncbi:uncharacterized protein EV420DRAFT_25805 [Desarmillaria tabescens]|uniref:Xylanolytic transcriptional activator regulatory domain-containing protein n=1 Tax=Armillaria tabescens TaxID=1929756 RepID=A0AA39NPE7_ARMTA|nr:uncharacterized protein EV420DRAFT_25805 [Desarmillaria tabescens]KAK0469356.1 hypothetical protein EV420DRAFT_25805 [Desarmillaria tabescens]
MRWSEAHRGVTRAQTLEEQISVLQSRIQDLEQPGHSDSSITLSHPYHQHRPAEFASATGQPLLDDDFPIKYRETILQHFVQRSYEIGFFMDISRFIDSLSSFSRTPPSTALLSAVYLWGVHLSPISELSAYEPIVLQRAIQAVAQGLSTRHPQIILHCIQAEVLLANYFLRKGRLLEGTYHTSTAVSLVLSARLHRIRSTEPTSADSLYVGVEATLPPLVDLVEEGERINAFWAVLILNNCWSAADGSPSNISYMAPDARVDLPWPLDMASYHQVNRPPQYRTSHTIQRFLSNNTDDCNSIVALHAKASILYEQASRVGAQFRPGMQQQEAARFFATFSTLERVIQRFLEELPSLIAMAGQSSLGTTVVVHTLAQMAMIQLHAPFLARNPSSHGRTVTGFRAIAQIIQSIDISRSLFLDPIVGVLWVNTCKLLMREISGGQGASTTGNEPLQLLNLIMAAISTGARHWPHLGSAHRYSPSVYRLIADIWASAWIMGPIPEGVACSSF